ncbi:MAG: anhydro-N-acetylmuramic acid kinase [Alcanivorax sp.]|nr:anhydro-N-acetylmuramic acid kinase [Alcanivorax sp.]
MKTSSHLYIGLMTGTSVDGIDAVLTRQDDQGFTLLDTASAELDIRLRDQILTLCQPGANEIDRLGPVHRQLGLAYAEAVKTLLEQSHTRPEQIRAIGCHGQTVRHRPGGDGFSLQLGCPDTLACNTGITVVSNFRNKDMVLGGQGAPLVPRFHQQLFGRPDERLAVANIGGMANVTLLDKGQLSGGFDTGPGNVLMDYWTGLHRGQPFDRNGDWAASGRVDTSLLEQLLSDRYFHQPPPKSTGREHFDAHWLDRQLPDTLSAPDIQATLAELTARSLSDALQAFAPDTLLVCGGGAHNRYLLSRLQALLAIPVDSTATRGLDPDWVEAAAFAWLAHARLEEIGGNAPAVTGASREAILGQVTLP